jgi:quercetin dioxygenase-like cupin family protein
MRIAEISSLVEAVPPKLCGATEHEELVSLGQGEAVRERRFGDRPAGADRAHALRLASEGPRLAGAAHRHALHGCKRWRSLREGIMRRVLLTAASLLALTRMSAAADSDIIASTHDGDLAAIRSLLPADHPKGIKATVTLVSLRLAPSLHDLVLSTFLIDYAPGGSAVLHRASAPGYVLVHVLSGAVRAQAWGAGVGIYRAGQTWTEPAFANDIASENASNDRPARALVVLVTTHVSPRELEGQ